MPRSALPTASMKGHNNISLTTLVQHKNFWQITYPVSIQQLRPPTSQGHWRLVMNSEAARLEVPICKQIHMKHRKNMKNESLKLP